MKIYIIRIILLLLLLETFVIIFGFSSQNGEDSSSVSRRVTNILVDIVKKDISTENREKIIKKTEIVIRKLAHFSIYLIVGFLLMSLASTYNLELKTKIIFCLLIGILYATSDEIHQLFVDGRSGQITDVFIDTFGVITGIVISNFIINLYKKIKNSHKLKVSRLVYTVIFLIYFIN